MSSAALAKPIVIDNPYTHCGHGRKYGDPCADCERVWADAVTLPCAIRSVKKLRRFYSEAKLRAILFEKKA